MFHTQRQAGRQRERGVTTHRQTVNISTHRKRTVEEKDGKIQAQKRSWWP